MAKTAKRHRCIDCGSTTARWAGRCPTCGEWNTLVEEAQLGSLVQAVDALGLSTMPVQLSSVDVSEAAAVPTGSGGVRPGALGRTGARLGHPARRRAGHRQVHPPPPGLAARAAAGHRVLLISAEESAHQVRLRAERLGPIPPGLLILPVTEVGAVVAAVAEARARPGGGRLHPGRVDRPVPAGRAADHRGAGQRDPGARVRRPVGGPGQVQRGGDRPGRPRDQGRLAGRSPGPRAHGGHRAELRGRPAPRPPAPPGGQAPVRADRRARPVRDGGPGAQPGGRPRAAPARRPPRRACRAAWCSRPSRAAAPCWSSSRPW